MCPTLWRPCCAGSPTGRRLPHRVARQCWRTCARCLVRTRPAGPRHRATCGWRSTARSTSRLGGDRAASNAERKRRGDSSPWAQPRSPPRRRCLGARSAPILFPAPPPSIVRLVATPRRLSRPVAEPDVAVSPDGARITYVTVGRTVRHLRSLPSASWTTVRIGNVGVPRSPFFSPDGQSIGFFDGALSSECVEMSGGPADHLPRRTRGASRRQLGRGRHNRLRHERCRRIAACAGDRGRAQCFNQARGTTEDHHFPEVLPGGRAVLFTNRGRAQPAATAQIAILNLESASRRCSSRASATEGTRRRGIWCSGSLGPCAPCPSISVR